MPHQSSTKLSTEPPSDLIRGTPPKTPESADWNWWVTVVSIVASILSILVSVIKLLESIDSFSLPPYLYLFWLLLFGSRP